VNDSLRVSGLSCGYHYREELTVRNTLLAAAVAATLALAANEAGAATSANSTQAEIQAMQAQMKDLADRLNRLEQANSQLQQENAQLKATTQSRDAEITQLKTQTADLSKKTADNTAAAAKLKAADWTDRIKVSGDFRAREEYISADYVAGSPPTSTTPSTLSVENAADTWRTRFRFRLAAQAQVTENTKVGFRLESGDGNPRSPNQTFTNESSAKGLYIGQAYADWTYMKGADLVIGKQPLMFWRPTYSLLWDGDVNPEAVATTYKGDMFFGSAWAWMVQQNVHANTNYVNVDPTIFGVQGGLTFPVAGGETKIAALYYQLANGKGNAPFYQDLPFGNTTYARYLNGSSTPTQVLAYDYNVLQVSGQMVFPLGGLPLTLWGDWAQNMASHVQYDKAWTLGAGLGKASNPNTWEASILYEQMDKDAMFAQFIDSDFGAGVAGANGWVFKAGYAPVKNVVVNATYFLNHSNVNTYAVSGFVSDPNSPYYGPYGVGKDMKLNGFQFDVNYKF
jgi:hypothetical protein